jgi:hypothetical protein
MIQNRDSIIAIHEFSFMSEALALYDGKIKAINEAIYKPRDPISDGLCDRGEYFFGLGFIAIQCYFDALINGCKLSKQTFPPWIQSFRHYTCNVVPITLFPNMCMGFDHVLEAYYNSTKSLGFFIFLCCFIMSYLATKAYN